MRILRIEREPLDFPSVAFGSSLCENSENSRFQE
jgi:hypothetical protein